MSWAGIETSYSEKEYSKQDIMMEVAEVLERDCSHSFTPHHQQWKFFDEVCATEEEAQEFLSNKHLYREYNRAVRYRVPTGKTKKIQALEARLEVTVETREQYKKDHHPSTFKAEFIGCPTCKSKIAKKYIKGYSHSCPVCSGELWSETTQKKIAGYNEKIADIQKQIKQRKRRPVRRTKNWLGMWKLNCILDDWRNDYGNS